MKRRIIVAATMLAGLAACDGPRNEDAVTLNDQMIENAAQEEGPLTPSPSPDANNVQNVQ